MNFDGKVDVRDIMRVKVLRRDGSATHEETAYGDMDTDGELTVADVAEIKAIILTE